MRCGVKPKAKQNLLHLHESLHAVRLCVLCTGDEMNKAQLSCAVLVHLLIRTVQQQQQQHNDKMTTTVPTTDVDCNERASCSYADESRRNCYCDDLCHIFDDCCADYDVTMTPASDVMTPSGATVSCQRLPGVMTRQTQLYVVSRCPSSYNDTDVVRRCQLHASDNAVDRFYRVPVVVQSDALRLTYRNVYCAACTAVNARPAFYVIEVRCRSLPVGANVSVASLLQSSSCRVVYVAPPLVTPARTCLSHISRCDRRWANEAVADRCRRGAVSYVYAGVHVFRNRHCAHCNYVNDTYVSCDVTSLQRPVVSAAAGDVATWRTAIVIDINHRRSVLNYVTRRQQQQQQQQAIYELPRCQQQHVYDPFTEQCRLVPSLELTDDLPTTTSSQRVDVASSVTANGSHYQFSLYAAKTRAERVTALLASVVTTIALVVVVVVYALRPALRAHVHGQTLLALVVSLLLMQLIYVLVLPLVDVIGRSSVTCFCLSVALHYVSLTSVCWLNALAIVSLDREKCRSFACSCVYATSAALPVVISMLMLSILRLDGSDGGPTCWTLGLGQLMLHTTMLATVLGVNCVLYAVTLYRRLRAVRGPMCVSMLLTLIVITDAGLTVAAAVWSQSTGVTYLSLAMHAALGPLVSLSVLLPFCLHADSSLHRQHVRHMYHY